MNFVYLSRLNNEPENLQIPDLQHFVLFIPVEILFQIKLSLFIVRRSKIRPDSHFSRRHYIFFFIFLDLQFLCTLTRNEDKFKW